MVSESTFQILFVRILYLTDNDIVPLFQLQEMATIFTLILLA